MINLEQYRETMYKIRKCVETEKDLLEKENIPAQGASEDENIDNLILRASDVSFRLLIMGRFSSGKSTMINALLGEKILPEKALPATAIITEIYYGEQKKVVMYPKAGKWQGGDKPFEIEPTLSEISRYSTLNNKGGINSIEANRIDSCFEKMVIFWPLELLKDGVCIIDSPGTDDPYSNDYIVESYMPKADAILYCMNGLNAYSAKDRNTLESITARGFKNPIIVTTYFDYVCNGMSSEEEREEFIDTTFNSYYSRHTNRECCHYVDSRSALEAKKSNNHADFVKSGFAEMETFLGKYLSEERGKEKISGITSAVKLYNAAQEKRIDGIITNLDIPLEDFNVRAADAQTNLEQARAQGDMIMREYRLETKRAQDEIKTILPSLYDKLMNELDLGDFEPATNFTIWHPQKSSEQIAEECAKEVEIRNKNLVGEWNETVLTPKLTETFKKIAEKMTKQIDLYSSDLNSANMELGINTDKANTEISTGSRVAMLAYAMITGDWINAALGNVYGVGAFGRSLACQFAAGMLVGVIGLFVPVGLPALVIAALAGLIGGQFWNAKMASSSIKKKTLETVKENIKKDKDKIFNEVEVQCSKIFSDFEERLKQAIADDIAEVEATIESIQKEKVENISKIEERKSQLTEVQTFLNQTNEEMDSVREQYGIA